MATLLSAAVGCAGPPATPSSGSPPAPPPAAAAPTGPASGALSLAASLWETVSTPQNFKRTNDPGGSLVLDFPGAPNSLGYLYNTRPPGTIAGSLAVSFRIETTGAPVFNYAEPGNTCVVPATVRPFVWAHRNSFLEFDRWWANPLSHQLVQGEGAISVPLTPDQWSSVNGKSGTADAGALAGFQSALDNVSSLGLTFGGGCFFGHGVNVYGGTARFVLTGYEVR